jgi:hypothetical protein
METLAVIIVFSSWIGLWLLLRAEGRLIDKQFNDRKRTFMVDQTKEG